MSAEASTRRPAALAFLGAVVVLAYAGQKAATIVSEGRRQTIEVERIEADMAATRNLLTTAPSGIEDLRAAGNARTATIQPSPAWTPETAEEVAVETARKWSIEVKTVVPSASETPRAGVTLRGTGPAVAAYAGAVEASGGRFAVLALRVRGGAVEATAEVVGPVATAATPPGAEPPQGAPAEPTGAIAVADLAARLEALQSRASAEETAPYPARRPVDLAEVARLPDPFRVGPPADAMAASPPPPPFEYVGRIALDDGRSAALIEGPDGIARPIAPRETYGGYTLVEAGLGEAIFRTSSGPRRIPLRTVPDVL